VDLTDLVDVVEGNGEIKTIGKVRVVRRGALSVDKLKLVLGENLEA
jgi:hypothetical protein